MNTIKYIKTDFLKYNNIFSLIIIFLTTCNISYYFKWIILESCHSKMLK